MDFISLFALRIGGEVSYCVTTDYSKRRKVMQTKRHEGWTIDEPPARQ